MVPDPSPGRVGRVRWAGRAVRASVLPKMSARSRLVGKNTPALFGTIQTQFSMRKQMINLYKQYFYLRWWANGPHSPGLGSCADVIL